MTYSKLVMMPVTIRPSLSGKREKSLKITAFGFTMTSLTQLWSVKLIWMMQAKRSKILPALYKHIAINELLKNIILYKNIH